MNVGEAAMSSKDGVTESWMMPHMWRANLTGWRPHMRIDKDTDYSVWIEVRDQNNRYTNKLFFVIIYSHILRRTFSQIPFSWSKKKKILCNNYDIIL